MKPAILSIVPNSINEEVAFVYLQRLRDMREDADLSQENVAAYLGIKQTVYSRYERGERAIPVKLLIRLAELYNVSIDFLCGRTNDMKLHK